MTYILLTNVFGATWSTSNKAIASLDGRKSITHQLMNNVLHQSCSALRIRANNNVVGPGHQQFGGAAVKNTNIVVCYQKL